MKSKRKVATGKTKLIVGWRERVDLPRLGLFGVKAKVDTGARTSSLHVETMTPIDSNWLRLEIAYVGLDGAEHIAKPRVPSRGLRRVKSSSGHAETRHVVETLLRIGEVEYAIELTLTDRSDMKFPMLIGRNALRGRFLVDSGRAFVQSSSSRTSGTTRRKILGETL